MKTSEFLQYLQNAAKHELRFTLPDGTLIPLHAHITEVGRTDRQFLDCGGTIRHVSTCTLQAWVDDDVEHRFSPSGLASVIKRASSILKNDDLEVEIEYEHGLLSQFPVIKSITENASLTFQLGIKHTDCLAKEICLPPKDNACCAQAGCC